MRPAHGETAKPVLVKSLPGPYPVAKSKARTEGFTSMTFVTFPARAVARAVKAIVSAKPVPCWTEYLRETGGLRG